MTQEDTNETKSLEHGVQPLDALMEELELRNTDLVRISPSQLTHKNVSKARSGRAITKKIQLKVMEAFTLWCRENQEGPSEITLETLFNYRGN